MKSFLPFVILFVIGVVTLIVARLLIVRIIEKPKKKEKSQNNK
jgi:flagellar biosynthesis/type III secretory pathway M-ring protein FliF/YscJ